MARDKKKAVGMRLPEGLVRKIERYRAELEKLRGMEITTTDAYYILLTNALTVAGVSDGD